MNKLQLHLHPQEFVAILGPSGIGKTTLLRLLAGILEPNEGTILIQGKSPSEHQGKIGLVFQHYTAFPWLTVEQNIAFGLRLQNKNQDTQTTVEKLLALTQLEGQRNQFPEQLSGGQKQRVALARTLAVEPELLLLDEPFGALDSITRHQIQQALSSLCQAFKPTTLMITHDIEEALFLADRIVVLQGKPASIRAIIQNPFSKPRKPAIKYTPEFQAAKKQLIEQLQENTYSGDRLK